MLLHAEAPPLGGVVAPGLHHPPGGAPVGAPSEAARQVAAARGPGPAALPVRQVAPQHGVAATPLGRAARLKGLGGGEDLL